MYELKVNIGVLCHDNKESEQRGTIKADWRTMFDRRTIFDQRTILNWRIIFDWTTIFADRRRIFDWRTIFDLRTIFANWRTILDLQPEELSADRRTIESDRRRIFDWRTISADWKAICQLKNCLQIKKLFHWQTEEWYEDLRII